MSWYGFRHRKGHSPKYAAEDALWGKAIRERDSRCRWCGRVDRQLNACHWIGRRKMSTRFELDNGFAMCAAPCHREFDAGKKLTKDGPSDLWVLRQLGQQRFDRLRILANVTLKPDKIAVRMVLRRKP